MWHPSLFFFTSACMRASDTHADGQNLFKNCFLGGRGANWWPRSDPTPAKKKKKLVILVERLVFDTGGEKADLTSSSQEPSRSWGAPASLITTPLERLRLKGWNQRPLSAHMAVKTTLHLQNSVVARKQEWSSNLVLLGWSSRLTFPLEGILEVIMFN